jgi:hypothetical protein
MQVYNDTLNLSTSLLHLGGSHPDFLHLSQGLSDRMLGLGTWVFEGQMEMQRKGIAEVIDGIEGFVGLGEDVGVRRAEKGIRGVVHNLESLARVIKVSFSSRLMYSITLMQVW